MHAGQAHLSHEASHSLVGDLHLLDERELDEDRRTP